MKFSFIGLTVDESKYILSDDDKAELKSLGISFLYSDGKYYLYIKGEKLREYEVLHFQNQLKRIRNDELYNIEIDGC